MRDVPVWCDPSTKICRGGNGKPLLTIGGMMIVALGVVAVDILSPPFIVEEEPRVVLSSLLKPVIVNNFAGDDDDMVLVAV